VDDAKAKPPRRETVIAAAHHRAVMTTRLRKEHLEIGIGFEPF